MNMVSWRGPMIPTGFGLALTLMLVLVFASCGKEEQPKVEPSKYLNWAVHFQGHFAIYFSPASIYGDRQAMMAQGFERFMSEICELLEMPVPSDTIQLYVYASDTEAVEVAGRAVPFSNDKEIHWCEKQPYGYELTKFLLARKGVTPGKFHVTNEGVPHLLDFSGVNYHNRTTALAGTSRFVRLADLGNNNVFDTINVVFAQAESASLCGYIMYTYGLDRLLMLWNSLLDWNDAIKTIFQSTVEEFEKSWLAFAQSQSVPQTPAGQDTVQK